jgi:hypothetical protein
VPGAVSPRARAEMRVGRSLMLVVL